MRKLIIATGLLLVAGVVSFLVTQYWYYETFGPSLSSNHATWAEFGNFFGGLLSPIMAFIAIVMLFFTLMSQMIEFRKSVQLLNASASAAREELELLKSQNVDNETLSVLVDADQKITLLLQSEVSEQGCQPIVTIFHMCIEGQRIAENYEESAGYIRFVDVARSKGSVVWSQVQALSEIVDQVTNILLTHSSRYEGQPSPIIVYYQQRIVGIAQMLEDTGFITEKEHRRIKTMADKHG